MVLETSQIREDRLDELSTLPGAGRPEFLRRSLQGLVADRRESVDPRLDGRLAVRLGRRDVR